MRTGRVKDPLTKVSGLIADAFLKIGIKELQNPNDTDVWSKSIIGILCALLSTIVLDRVVNAFVPVHEWCIA